MKIIQNPATKLLSLVLFAATFVLASCSKKDDASTSTSFVMITNAAEGSASQDFYLDNNKVNASAVAYAQSSSYMSVTSGDRQAKFTDAGSATANTSFTLSMQSGGYYSAYYSGGSSGYVVTQDDLSAPSSGKAKVRFIHLASAISSGVDFGVSAGSKLVSNLAYKAASTYYTVDANTAFSLYLAGSSTATLNIPTTIQAGKIYTIYVSGATQATVTYHIVAQN